MSAIPQLRSVVIKVNSVWEVDGVPQHVRDLRHRNWTRTTMTRYSDDPPAHGIPTTGPDEGRAKLSTNENVCPLIE